MIGEILELMEDAERGEEGSVLENLGDLYIFLQHYSWYEYPPSIYSVALKVLTGARLYSSVPPS